MIIYGLFEQKAENSESLEAAANQKVIAHILELDPVAIECIHRLGKPAPGNVRPVIFTFLNFRNKLQILKTGAKLQDTQIYIGEDFRVKISNVRNKV